MEQTGQASRLTSLLDNRTLSRVERLRINTSGRFTNRMRGEHLSGKGGNSIEFSDYRDYVAGDDIRFVDWNIFSRLQRPYVKLFHQEEEKHVVILIDASNSMQFEGKLQRAKELAAAFSIMGLYAQEPVSVYVFNDGDGALPTSGLARGRGKMRELFRFIENVEGGGTVPLDEGVDLMLRQHRGRGAIVVLSDFLTFGDLQRTFNALFSSGLELFALQILAPMEIDPDLTSDLRLVDCEVDQTLDVTAAGDLLGIYQEHLQAFQNHLQMIARQRSGRFVSTSSMEPLGGVLFDTLRRKGWVK